MSLTGFFYSPEMSTTLISSDLTTAGIIGGTEKATARSDSPTKPKYVACNPVRAADQLVTVKTEPVEAELDMGSLACCSISPEGSKKRCGPSNQSVTITDDMFKEEQKLHEITLQEEEEIKKKSQESMKCITDDIKIQRKQRLQFLLSKSNMYASYLVKRMKEQREEIAIKEERKQKKVARKIEKENSLVQNEASGNVIATIADNSCVKEENSLLVETRASRRSPRVPNNSAKLTSSKQAKVVNKQTKRKATESVENYKISDYLEEVLETNKRQKLENGAAKEIIMSEGGNTITDAAEETKDEVEDKPDRFFNG